MRHTRRRAVKFLSIVAAVGDPDKIACCTYDPNSPSKSSSSATTTGAK
jgi:hypothetical protein